MVEGWQTVISADVIEFFSPWPSALPSRACARAVAASWRCICRISACSKLGRWSARLAAVPLLIFSAPYLIMRNTLRGGPLERRRGEVVMVATVIAGLWSLMSGTVVVMALQALLSV